MPLLLEQNSLLLSEFFMENGEMSCFSCYYQGKLLFLHLDLNICYICPVYAGDVQIAEYKPFDTNAYEIKKQTGNGRFGYAYIINYIDQLTKQEKRSCPYLNILYGAFSSCSLYLEYRQYSHVRTSRLKVHAIRRGLFCACRVEGHLAVTLSKGKLRMGARLSCI